MTGYKITKTPKEIDKLSPNYYWNKAKAYFSLHGIHREEVAAVLGVSLATVSAYNKDASAITLDSICKICRAYDLNGISALEDL